MIFADENIEQYWIELIQSKGYDVYSIRIKHPGISDIDIIQLVKEQQGILLTEDKDLVNLYLPILINTLLLFFFGMINPSTIRLNNNC
jgi:predicted nuclease of predicted toxin-antitoxin system